MLWSLAIEEQFYLAVGILIAVASTRRDSLAAAFFVVALVVTAVALRYRVEIVDLAAGGQITDGQYTARLSFSTLARMDQLALGLLTALVAPSFSAWFRPRSPLFAWAGVAAAVSAIVHVPKWPVLSPFVLGLAFVLCVVLTQLPSLPRPRSRLGAGALAFVANIGKVSFGLYLFHPFVRRLLLMLPCWEWSWPDKGLRAHAFLYLWFLVALAVANLSYRFMEAPLLRWARERSRRVPSAPKAAAVATSDGPGAGGPRSSPPFAT